MRPVILIAVLCCATSARAETDPRKLFGKEDPDAPITPADVPLYASADGSRVGLAAAAKKKGCDPEDQYGEGRCDFEVTFEVRDAAGKAVEKLKFVLGNFKQKSDVTKLSERITAL